MNQKMPKYMVEALRKVTELSNEDLFEIVTTNFPSDEMDCYGHETFVHNAHCEELKKRLIEKNFLDHKKMAE